MISLVKQVFIVSLSFSSHLASVTNVRTKSMSLNKNYCTCKKDYSWNPSTCICEDDKHLKSIADTSVVTCDEIISVMDIASTKMTNTVATNVSINSDIEKINCHSKDVRYKIDSYILHSVLVAIILLLIITFICYH